MQTGYVPDQSLAVPRCQGPTATQSLRISQQERADETRDHLGNTKTHNQQQRGKINEQLTHVHNKSDVTEREQKNYSQQKIRKTNSSRARIFLWIGLRASTKFPANFLTNNSPISPKLLRCSGCIAFMTSTGPTDIVKKSVLAVLLWDQLTVLAVFTDRR